MSREKWEELRALWESGKLTDGTPIVDGMGEALDLIEHLSIKIELAMRAPKSSQAGMHLTEALVSCRDFLS